VGSGVVAAEGSRNMIVSFPSSLVYDILDICCCGCCYCGDSLVGWYMLSPEKGIERVIS
jgi:hypothetical protein